jgi:TonB family protein
MGMRKAAWILLLLALAAAAGTAQQELSQSTQDGPMNIKPAAPRPASDGAFTVGPGVVAPIILERATIVYPTDAAPGAIEGDCVLSMIVGEDGTASNIQVVRSHGASFDAAAIAAVRQSKFDPGTVNGKAVPVHMFARTRFFADLRPTYPRSMVRFGAQSGFPHGPMSLGDLTVRLGSTAPRPITTAEPEYTDEARKNRIQGVVTISVLVDEEGIPIDPQIIHSLDPGLDEKAVECALKYRFRPAMRDGAPVSSRITIEMNFRLY